MALIDSQVRLFNGDYSLTELLQMDIPFKKSLVLARIANLERSREKFEKRKELDAFSNKDILPDI